MNVNDVQDVCGSSEFKRPLKAAEKYYDKHVKKPDGMHRELFNLLVHQGKEQTIHSIMPSNTKKGYTSAKAKTMEPITFTSSEYLEYLQHPDWTIEETAHLLDICHLFDLRWPVIYDKFTNKTKSMEVLKERYYNLCRDLLAARGQKPDTTSLFEYDAEHERRRKEQLLKLWNRTDEEIKEEEELKTALKRIESKRKDRERKAIDLQRLINATDRTSVSPDNPSSPGSTSTPARGQRKNKTKNVQAVVQLIAPNETLNIRYHEFRSSGPHLRSQEMKLPSNLGQKKHKNIDTEIKIEPRMRVNSVDLPAGKSKLSKDSGGATSNRRIEQMIDINPSSLSSTRVRRRENTRTSSNNTNMDK